MAIGLEPGLADTTLDGILVPATTYYIQFHTGGPGPAGTNHLAGETTRHAIVFGASSGGVKAQSSTVTIASATASETWTYASYWDALMTGTFIFSGQVTADPVTAGQAVSIAPGSITVNLNVAG